MEKVYHKFEDYLQDRYYNELYSALEEAIRSDFQRYDWGRYRPQSSDIPELDSLRVCCAAIYSEFLLGNNMFIDIGIKADTILQDEDSRGSEAETVSCWFTVSCSARLSNGLKDFTIIDVEPYSKAKFDPEMTLSRYLIPYMRKEDMEAKAEEVLQQYIPDAFVCPKPLDVAGFLANRHLKLLPGKLPDGIWGRSYFGPSQALIYKDPQNISDDSLEIRQVDRGTIVVDPKTYLNYSQSIYDNTILHEAVHQIFHWRFFELRQLLCGNTADTTSITCYTGDFTHFYQDDKAKEAYYWMERQANTLSYMLQIPRRTAVPYFEKLLHQYAETHSELSSAEQTQLALFAFSATYNVSPNCAKYRLIDLGFFQVRGCLFHLNNVLQQPYFFRKPIRSDQTYEISQFTYWKLMLVNPEVRKMLAEGTALYADGFLCLNTSKFLLRDEHGQLHLTSYARDHIDECCFLFTFRHRRHDKKYDQEFYNECCLCRDVDASVFVESEFQPDEEDTQSKRDMLENIRKIKAECVRLQSERKEIPSSFGGTLAYHMKKKNFDVLDLSAESDVSEVSIRKYLQDDDAKIEKQTALALAVSMHIGQNAIYDLLRKAGYDFSSVSRAEDIFYNYLITHHPMSSRETWNNILKEAGYPSIPGPRSLSRKDKIKKRKRSQHKPSAGSSKGAC